MNEWAVVLLIGVTLFRVVTSTDCNCTVDGTICTPPDGDIDCRNCGVYYKHGKKDFFQCVNECPDGYYGSQTLSVCVPCSNITAHCVVCTSYEDGTNRCVNCEDLYTLRRDICSLSGPSSILSTAVLVVFFVILALVVALIFAIYFYKRCYRTRAPENDTNVSTVSGNLCQVLTHATRDNTIGSYHSTGIRNIGYRCGAIRGYGHISPAGSAAPGDDLRVELRGYEPNELLGAFSRIKRHDTGNNTLSCSTSISSSEPYGNVIATHLSTAEDYDGPDPRAPFSRKQHVPSTGFEYTFISAHEPMRLQVDDVGGYEDVTVFPAIILPLRTDMEVTHPSPTTDNIGFSEDNKRFYWTFTVGPAGGTFRVMNIILSIAKGSVEKDVTIKIAVSRNDQDKPPQNPGYYVVGPIIHCLPHGLHFKKTVALSFGYNLHFSTQKASPNLQVLYSDSDVDAVPVWKEHDSASTNFTVGGSGRCLVFIDHFCVFTVVNKTTGSETLAKGVRALVYADCLARKMRLVSHCVDNEVTEIELFKCVETRDSGAAFVGSQPFIVYENQNHISLSVSDVASSWELQDQKTKANICKMIAFLKVWKNMHPSCSFLLQSTSPDVATEVSCSVVVKQENGDEESTAHITVMEDIDKFQESSRHLHQINSSTRLNTVPHQLKMQLASVLDPPDHLRGHDWRHLASVLGLDEKILYLENKGHQTELLLMVWEMRNYSLTSLAATMRDIEREDAASVIKSFQGSRSDEIKETSPNLEEECELPDDLKTELVLLLNPIDQVNGHDWRHLAALLGLDNKIRFLQRKTSPTDVLLDHCEIENISLPTLAAMMRTMEREDVAVTVERYIT